MVFRCSHSTGDPYKQVWLRFIKPLVFSKEEFILLENLLNIVITIFESNVLMVCN